MQRNYKKQIDDILKTIHALPGQVQKATILALNRTAEWLKGHVAKEISREKRVKLKIIRDRIQLLRADKRYIRSHLKCHLQDIPVMQLGGVRQNAIGTIAGGVLYPHAFIATLGNAPTAAQRKAVGKPNIYRRLTKDRFPVKVVRLSIYEITSKLVRDLLGKEVKEVFQKRFLHEITRISGAIT